MRRTLRECGPPDESAFLITNLGPVGLLPGVNFLAAEIHQGDPASSDISFELELRAVRTILAPFITGQPLNVVTNAGVTAAFSVLASGAPLLHYQWRHAGTNLAGANAPILTLDHVQPEQAGNYFVVVTNALGAVTSLVATLTLTAPIPPQLQIESTPSAVRVQFLTAAGQSYTVQSSTNLAPGSWFPWTNLSTAQLPGLFQFSVETSNTPSRFFRVVTPQSGP